MDISCGSIEKHQPHNHMVNMDIGCSGRTPCGAWSHSAHIVKTQILALCVGVGYNNIPSNWVDVNTCHE